MEHKYAKNAVGDSDKYDDCKQSLEPKYHFGIHMNDKYDDCKQSLEPKYHVGIHMNDAFPSCACCCFLNFDPEYKYILI